jgi:SAM-dependent methyltransferase
MTDPIPPGRHRESFDSVPELYNSYRPEYPEVVVRDVITSARLVAGSQVLEIGCGTGQLTRPLAMLGVNVVAVELGPHLAALAKQKLASFSNAQIEVGAFEEWPLPATPFDAVVAATAFHWLDPEVRLTKSARALKPGGFLTLAHAHHVQGGTPGFIEDTQVYYLQWGLSDDPFFQPTAPADVPTTYPELDSSPLFDSVERHRFEVPRKFSSAAEYVGWLNTDSLVLGLADQARQGFLNDIETLVASKYDGVVSRNWVYEVVVARRAQEK